MNKTSKKALTKNSTSSAVPSNHSNKQGALISFAKPPFLKTSSYLAAILTSCVFGAEYAQAACGTLASGTYNSLVSCSSSSGDATINTQPNTTVIIPDSGSLGGDTGIRVTSFIGAASLNLNDTSVISNDNAYGILSSAQNTTGSSSIKLTGDNTITMNSVDALSAVWAQSGINGQAGTASIDVTGTLNIINHGLNYSRLAAGLVTMDNAFGAGSSSNMSIQHQGSGTISTLSSPAIYARSFAEHADIDIGVGSGVILDVTRSSVYDSGQASAAISVEARSATGLTTVDNAGTILLRGNGNGINIHTAGDIDISNTGSISGINPTAGQGYFTAILADANYQSANVRNVTIDNSGAITVTGAGTQLTAIDANVYNGSIDITNRGAITADQGTGINAQISNYLSTGDITISSEASMAFNNNGAGISASNAGSGNVTVTGSGDINTGSQTNSWANGMQVSANNGDVTVDYSGDLSVAGTGIQAYASNGDVKIRYTGDSLLLNGDYSSRGLLAYGQNVQIENTAAIRGIGLDATGISASAARYDDSAFNLMMHNQGDITLANGTGIQTSSYGAAQIDIANSGDISIMGDYGRGLSFQSGGPTDGNVTNSGNIATTGNQSDGIYIHLSGRRETDIPGHLETHNSGVISTIGDQSHGINVISNGLYNGPIGPASPQSVLPADIIINNQAAISTMGAQSHGISAVVGLGTANYPGNINITNSDNISVHGFAKQVNDYYGPITLADSDGINATAASGNVNISNTASGVISAGAGTGISLSGATQNIDNAGLIGALSDHAVQFDHTLATTTPVYDYDTGTVSNVTTYSLGTTGNATLNNSGVITGLINASESTVNMDNSGQWNLRNFNDSDHDGVRDTLSVAMSDFGNSSSNQINNSGTLTLVGDEGAANTLNNSVEYSTGYTANAMALGGAVQGQILGVHTFTNSGIIDLSNNNTVGDVLIVSGSHSAGTAGGGVYVSDGGQLKINAVLNQGGAANSQSDMLVVDGTHLGSGATQVIVNNVGGSGALTVDNGIEVVRVLDHSQSAAGVFKLGQRTTAGLYEYDIYQNGVDASATDGNWYLRSLKTPDNKPVINPESTVYLRNLNAASTMFMHTLHDRLGEPQFTDAYKTGGNNPSSAWVRVVSNHTDSTGGNGQVDLNTDTNLVHLGTDIARWSNNGTDRWKIGLMGAYGQSKIDASANQLAITPSGFKRNATGKVDGYSVGGYATWYQNKDKPEGIYLDTWAQYGWYDNKVQGNTKAEESYNSTGWTASVEAGYAMIARDEGNNRQLMFEPQIQVAYNNFTSDDHTDGSGTRITDNNANGVITRVGARLYSRSTLNDNGIQPFVEANWWYSDAKNSLAFNGETMEDGTPNSRYELKAGLQGEVAKNWLMWGHAGVQFGSNEYNRYEGMVGIKLIF